MASDLVAIQVATDMAEVSFKSANSAKVVNLYFDFFQSGYGGGYGGYPYGGGFGKKNIFDKCKMILYI